MIRSQELAQALFLILKETESKKIDLVFKRFVDFVEKNNLISQLPTIIRYLESYNEKEKDNDTLFIESPFDVSDVILNDIKDFVGVKRSTLIQRIITPELIGGFRARYQGVIFDASIAYNLQVLKSRLIK